MGVEDRQQTEQGDEVANQNLEESGVLSPDQMKAPGAAADSDYEVTRLRTWDGAGNPIEHAVGVDEAGRLSEGTGRTSEDASASMRDPDQVLGPDATPDYKTG